MQIHLRQQLLSLQTNSSLSNKASDLPDLLHASFSKLSQGECNSIPPGSQPVPSITPSLSSSDLSTLITTILERASLSQSQTNIEIVTSLLQNQMPVSKTMIQSILASHRNNQDIPIDMLVLSKKNDCTITEKTINELARFIPNETSVSNELQQLSTEFLTLLEHPEAFESEKDFIAYRNTFMAVLSEKSSSLPSSEYEPVILKETDLSKTTPSENNHLTSTLLTKETGSTITSPDSPLLSEQLITQQNGGVSTPSSLIKGSATLSDLPLKETVKELFLNLFSVSPNQLKKPNSALQQFRSVTEQLKELYVKAETHLSKEAKESMEAQYKSIRQATSDLPIAPEHCTYIQLPIRLNEQVVYSDLYFITDQKKSTSDVPSFTALLHLNLEHLKNLDICLHLASNHISASFYSEDEMISDFLKDHVNQLSDCLNQAGMVLNSNFFIRTKQQTALSQLEDHNESSIKTNQFSFDIRT